MQTFFDTLYKIYFLAKYISLQRIIATNKSLTKFFLIENRYMLSLQTAFTAQLHQFQHIPVKILQHIVLLICITVLYF